MDVDVAVVGGGPSGLAVALALSKVLPPGVSVKVFEAHNAYTESGAGVALRVNGMRALEALDPTLAHRIYEKGNYSRRSLTYNDVTGQQEVNATMYIDHTQHMTQTGHTSCLVYWNDLRVAIHEFLPPGTVQFGCRLSDSTPIPAAQEGPDNAGAAVPASPAGSDADAPLSSQPHRYLLTMQRACSGTLPSRAVGSAAATNIAAAAAAAGDGSHCASAGVSASSSSTPELKVRAKVVIGADGYFSRVRRQLGDGVTPAFADIVSWRGSFTPQQLASASIPLPATLATRAARAAGHRWVPSGGFGDLKGRFMLLMMNGDVRDWKDSGNQANGSRVSGNGSGNGDVTPQH